MPGKGFPVSNQPPPFGGPGGPGGFGGNPPPPGQGNPPPPGFGGNPPPPGGFGGPPGYGGQPPGGQPPGGFGGGGQPPGFGGPGGPQGFGGGFQQPPKKSNAPLIVGIIAALVIIGGGAGAFFLLSGDDEEPVGLASPIATASDDEEASEDPTEEATTPDAPTPPPAPTGLPSPTAAPTGQPAPTPPPAPPTTGGGTAPAGPGESMTMGQSATGEITATTPTVDFFFDGVAGQAVQVSMIALDESLDPVLKLYGPDGVLIDENDDFDFSVNTNSRIDAVLPADGEYRIEADSFAGTTGAFEVTLTFPSVLTDSDTLSDAVPEISYDYEGTAGQVIRIDMVATDDSTDPLIRLIAPDGTEVTDDDGGEGFNARLETTLDQTGTYTIVATAFSDNYGPYELTVTEF